MISCNFSNTPAVDVTAPVEDRNDTTDARRDEVTCSGSHGSEVAFESGFKCSQPASLRHTNTLSNYRKQEAP